MKVSIGIIAGGKSSRMGSDKSKLNDLGKTFLDGLVDKFKDYDLIISANEDLPPYETVKDTYKDIGPLGGIYEILRATKNPYAFTVPVDMVEVDQAIVKASLMGLVDEVDCVCYRDEDRIYPASALYSKRILSVIEDQIGKKDYKLSNLLDRISTKYLDLKYFTFKDKFININRPTDYKKYATPLIAICGKKNSGKTTFIGRLVKVLSDTGIRVSVVKHDGHDFVLDQEDTDTFNYKENGAYETLIYNDKYYKLDGKERDLKKLISKMDKVDLIIVEGLKDSEFEKYEVIREGEPVANEKNLKGFIRPSDFRIENFKEDKNIKSFDINKPEVFVNFLREKFFL